MGFYLEMLALRERRSYPCANWGPVASMLGGDAVHPTAPAVVVGLELNGLGVVRSLGAAGLDVIALDTDPGGPGCASRHARIRPAAQLSGPALIESLLALRERLSETPVLLLTQEAAVMTVSAERDRLKGAYRLSMPDPGVMTALLDK